MDAIRESRAAHCLESRPCTIVIALAISALAATLLALHFKGTLPAFAHTLKGRAILGAVGGALGLAVLARGLLLCRSTASKSLEAGKSPIPVEPAYKRPDHAGNSSKLNFNFIGQVPGGDVDIYLGSDRVLDLKHLISNACISKGHQNIPVPNMYLVLNGVHLAPDDKMLSDFINDVNQESVTVVKREFDRSTLKK